MAVRYKFTKLAQWHFLFYEDVFIKKKESYIFNEHTNTLKETAHYINIDTILPPCAMSPCLSLMWGLHKFHLALPTTKMDAVNSLCQMEFVRGWVHVLATPPPLPFPPQTHTHTQIPCHGYTGHTLWVMEAGATEWMKLYGNAYIRLNIAVFWDIMLCHWVSLFLMLLTLCRRVGHLIKYLLVPGRFKCFECSTQ